MEWFDGEIFELNLLDNSSLCNFSSGLCNDLTFPNSVADELFFSSALSAKCKARRGSINDNEVKALRLFLLININQVAELNHSETEKFKSKRKNES